MALNSQLDRFVRYAILTMIVFAAKCSFAEPNVVSPLDKLPQTGPWTLEKRDVLEPGRLALALLSQKEPLFRLILDRMPKPARELLEEFRTNRDEGDFRVWESRLRTALVPVLNLVLQTENLHIKVPHASKNNDTLMLAAQNPTGDHLVHLNRMILEDAYTSYIASGVRIAFDKKGGRFAVVDNHQRVISFYRDEGSKISTCYVEREPMNDRGTPRRLPNIWISFQGNEAKAMWAKYFIDINIETGTIFGGGND
jgi:hypothetical protein